MIKCSSYLLTDPNGFAVLAHDARKPFYVTSELLKFDTTVHHYNGFENVEQRDTAGVWKGAS